MGKVKKNPTTWLTISDIHVGCQEIEQMSKEFFDEENGFFANAREQILEIKNQGVEFSGCAICGDFFDHQLSLNSTAAKFSMTLMHAFIQFFIVEMNAYLIVIQGTKNHDLDQLSIFEPFETEFQDRFFIVKTLATIEVNNHEILLIPEEYMKNQNEYYEEVFKEKYSFIFGHGYFKFNCFSKCEIERPMDGMPIFDQDEIKELAPITIFGHDHRNQSYEDTIFYNGSFSRGCHGQEEPKGFLISYYDPDNNEKEVFLIENKLAPTYHTIYLENLIKGEIDYDKAVKAIKKYKEHFDYLKIKIKASTVNNKPTMVELIKGAFESQYKKGIVIESPAFTIKDGKAVLVNSIDADKDDEESVEMESQFEFLLDTSLELTTKIQKFIELKHSNKDITTEITVDDIISSIAPIK